MDARVKVVAEFVIAPFSVDVTPEVIPLIVTLFFVSSYM